MPARPLPELVDLELVLAADASGSIDDGEIRLQREGYAAAITSGEILQAIGVGYLRRIALTYVEWGDQNSQAVVVPWQVIDGPESAAAFAQALRTVPRLAYGRNAIGSVIDFAQRQIEGNAHEGDRKVIDVSADSAYSWNGVPLPWRASARWRRASPSTASRCCAASAAAGRAATTSKASSPAASSVARRASSSPRTAVPASPTRCARSCSWKLPVVSPTSA